jgi:glycine hydroxymethyltransferase
MSTAAHATAIDKAVFPGLQGGPHNHTTAGIAVALREAAEPAFRDYAAAVVANAKALADALLAHDFDLVSGGTDNHLILVDLTDKGIEGKPAAKALDRAGIELNFNTVPYDRQGPSGIRSAPGADHPRPDQAQMPQVAGGSTGGLGRAKTTSHSGRIKADVRTCSPTPYRLGAAAVG